MVEKNTIFIPYLLRSGAIFQRGQPIRYWGVTDPNESITLELNDLKLKTVSDNFGKFEFKIPVQSAGGPYTIKLYTKRVSVDVADILFGDVWLLGGQSNMQLWMDRLKVRYPDETSKAVDSNIRFFEVQQKYEFSDKVDELETGNWVYAVKEQIKKLSSIGYFFAKHSHEEDGVPVGVVETAIGGTHIESWMSQESLQAIGEPVDVIRKLYTDEYISMINQSEAKYEEDYLKILDKCDTGYEQKWAQKSDLAPWKPVQLEALDNALPSGVVWLKNQVTVSDEMIGMPAEIRLGTMTDADEVFVNGNKIGETGYKYPPRNYRISSLKKHNEIIIRLKTFWGNGGLTKNKGHVLIVGDKSVDIDRSGEWSIAQGCILPKRKEQFFFQYQPTGLFNGMIYPIRKFSFKGLLWYQGESDTGRSIGYGKKFVNVIQEWRKIFQCSNLPVVFAQLPNCDLEPQHDWARLRNEQLNALMINNVAMVVTLGLGEDNDLHPLNKQDVAIKMYNAFLKLQKQGFSYCDGPLVKNAVHDGQQIALSFINPQAGLQVDFKQLSFELVESGNITKLNGNVVVDGNNIKIHVDQNTVITRNSRIRYGWANAPKIGIKNSIGIPASPFDIPIRSKDIDTRS